MNETEAHNNTAKMLIINNFLECYDDDLSAQFRI